MGYTISEDSVKKYEKLLTIIMEHKNDSLRIATSAPEKLSYEIHQAIASAKELEIEPFNTLDITISRKKAHIIVKHKREIVEEITVEKQYLKVEDPVDHFGVVAQATQHDFISCGMVFQSFVGDMEIVERWIKGRGLSIVSREPLTVEKV